MADRADLRRQVQSTAEDLMARGVVTSVQSISDGDEDGLEYVEIQLVVPELIYQDDDLLDKIYLAFQMLESGGMVVTVNTHPDRHN